MITPKTITIMTPAFNESNNVRICYEAVRDYFASELPQYSLEHLFIDNASTDDTFEILKSIASSDPAVKVIRNSRNFGPHQSPYYAILQSSGDAVIPIMADLQTPIELLGSFISAWEEGYKIVLGVRRSMAEKGLLRWARNRYYNWIERASNIEQVKHFTGFGLYDRRIVEIIRDFDDPSPYFRGIIFEVGFKKKLIEYDQPPRLRGKSKHSLWDLINYAILGVTSYSTLPLRLLSIMAVFTAGLSALVFFFYLLIKLIFWYQFELGVFPILLAVLFFGSVQIIALGIVGEYIGLMLSYLRRRPLVIEEERINFGE